MSLRKRTLNGIGKEPAIVVIINHNAGTRCLSHSRTPVSTWQIRCDFEDNYVVGSKHARGEVSQILEKCGVLIEPPKTWPSDCQVVEARAPHPFELGYRRITILRRTPV